MAVGAAEAAVASPEVVAEAVAACRVHREGEGAIRVHLAVEAATLGLQEAVAVTLALPAVVTSRVHLVVAISLVRPVEADRLHAPRAVELLVRLDQAEALRALRSFLLVEAEAVFHRSPLKGRLGEIVLPSVVAGHRNCLLAIVRLNCRVVREEATRDVREVESPIVQVQGPRIVQAEDRQGAHRNNPHVPVARVGLLIVRERVRANARAEVTSETFWELPAV